MLTTQGAHLQILMTRSLISTASLLALASALAAQNPQTLPQTSGSSISGALNSARYEFGRGLTFSSQDGGNSMTVGGQLQVGYSWTEFNFDGASVGSDFSFDSSFSADARLRVGGHVMDNKYSYFVQMNPSGGGQGTGNLIDAWVGMNVSDGIHLRLGQQKMRSGLSADTSANDTDFETISRSSATNEFANLRTTGALLTGNGMDGRFNWHFGIANGGTAANGASQILFGAAPASQANDDTDMAVTMGASFGSHAGTSEDWSEGDLARSGESQWIAGATITDDRLQGGGDLRTLNFFGGFKSGDGIAAQVEHWTREGEGASNQNDGYGAYAQVSYTMAKSGSMQPGFVARYSTVDFDGGADGNEFTLGVNAYYAAHNLKWQLEYASGTTGNFPVAGADDIDSSALRVLCTVVF